MRHVHDVTDIEPARNPKLPSKHVEDADPPRVDNQARCVEGGDGRGEAFFFRPWAIILKCIVQLKSLHVNTIGPQ